jgi:hypothetical protein
VSAANTDECKSDRGHAGTNQRGAERQRTEQYDDGERAGQCASTCLDVALVRQPERVPDGAIEVVDAGRGTPHGEHDRDNELGRNPGTICSRHPTELLGDQRAQRRGRGSRQAAEVIGDFFRAHDEAEQADDGDSRREGGDHQPERGA